MFMLFIPTNLTTRSAEPVKNDSLIFPHPIKVIGHMYQEESHGEFIIMGANSLAFYAKYDGVWSGNDLLK